ncbi:cobalt/nickel transport protein [Cetobacterium ceti]|uniref:Cobalt transport protein CbiN n=1 Tax=Cetobacterium ceti TaxID=180163 RepID=A0A1T4LC65_9FUSO|nr:energy-coupling factor ABC transporter substrate-binding protein [Cetobacterium ceti]SJZ52138.1 cobalt/nickel transport protein [Cetobacterium ceti]
MDKKKNNKYLWILVILIIVVPLLFIHNTDFGGSDDQAVSLIETFNPNYKPWVENIFTPPGGEIESFLFALQAAIGAGIIGYVFGFFRGKRNVKKS